jgi:hypothetical protein
MIVDPRGILCDPMGMPDRLSGRSVMGGNGTGNGVDGNEKPPQGFDLRGLVDAWASYLGFFRCQNTSLTAFRNSTVALCHAIDRKRAIGSPFSIMMAMTATLVVFHPAAFAAAWVALIALFTSAAVLLISSRLPPIRLKTHVKLVMASRSFLGVLVCGCAHHTTLIRRGVWIIHYRGKLFPNRLGIAQERSCACSVMSGVIVDSRGHFRGCNWDAWIWERICERIRKQRYGKRKTPAWVCHAGVGGGASGD